MCDPTMPQQPRGSDHIKVPRDAFHVLASVLGSCQRCTPRGELVVSTEHTQSSHGLLVEHRLSLVSEG